MKPTILHDEAKAELDDAAAWYERHRLGLGSELISAVQETISRIEENPELGKPYGSTRFRYALVRRFPYVVYYAAGKDAIRIVAIAHGRRRPGYWKRRRFG